VLLKILKKKKIPVFIVTDKEVPITINNENIDSKKYPVI